MCVCICASICPYTHVRAGAFIWVCLCACMSVCVCMCVQVHVNTCTHGRMWTSGCAHTNVVVLAGVWVCACMCARMWGHAHRGVCARVHVQVLCTWWWHAEQHTQVAAGLKSTVTHGRRVRVDGLREASRSM